MRPSLAAQTYSCCNIADSGEHIPQGIRQGVMALLRQVLQVDEAGYPALFIQDAAVQAADEDAMVGGDGDIRRASPPDE